MINTKNYKYKIIAGVLSLVMVIGLLLVVPPVSAQAVEINANDQGFTLFGAGSGTTTGFESGAQISVTNTSRIANSKKTAVYTYDGTAWSKSGDDYVVWQGTGDNTFEAYSPVAEGASYTGFTLPTDQTAGVSNADWMIATYTGAKGESDAINLTFQHLLAKVTVKVTAWGDQYTGTEALTVPTFVSLHSKATANGTTLNGDNTNTNVSATWTTDTNPTATVILVPGDYTGLENFFTFKVDENPLSVNAPDNLTLESGNHYTFDLTVGKDTVLVNSVSVTDWLDGDTLTGGDAERVELPFSYSADGKTGTATVTSTTSAKGITKAVQGAVDAGATTLILNGQLSEEQQAAIASALTDATNTILILSETTTVSEAITALTGIDLAYKNGTGANGYAVSSGTYLITGKAGLDEWCTAVSSNTSTNLTLMCDIEYNASWSKLNITYTGTIDGNGYAIKGLNCSEERATFIYEIGNAGVVKHLGITESSFYNTNSEARNANASAITYTNYGVIMGCYNTSSVSSAGNAETYGGAGGLVRQNAGMIVGCFNSGTVQAGGYYAGGIAMRGETGKIVSCYNTGSVSGYRHSVGAIVGYLLSASSVSDCYYSRYSAIGHDAGGTTTNLTQFTGTNWTTPMNTMNAAIVEYNKTASVKCNYRFAINTDTTTSQAQPLIIVEVEE